MDPSPYDLICRWNVKHKHTTVSGPRTPLTESAGTVLAQIGLDGFKLFGTLSVCKCILGWGSVMYHFQVTVSLTFDLVLRIIMS